MADIRCNIDGYELLAPAGSTILEAARQGGIEIPTLCHDPRVALYGACGLCTVEIEGSPKLARACSTKLCDGMVIHTDTARVISSRRVALELLLSDHDGDCRAPCSLSCPAGTDCQGYVGLIANGEYKEAVSLIKEKLPLPASIGRICPHPCETACRRQMVEEPVSIAWLKSFVADVDLQGKDTFRPACMPDTNKKISIIGGGPAGLTAAYFLRIMGHTVAIYDAMPKMGGMLRYGIPQYRLPKEVLDKEIDLIGSLGVSMFNGTKIGDDITLEELREMSDAVLVAVGAWTSSSMRVKGEELTGVLGGIDFLRGVALNEPVEIGDRVAVCGGGNTAMDACRTAVRLGAKAVYVIYRRTRAEMPAEDVEITEAEEEGVTFKFLTNPDEIIGENGRVSKVRLQVMELGEPDASGRRSPVPVEGKFEEIALDTVIMAIGQGVDAAGLEVLELTRRGTIAADETTFRTSLPDVFAAGDATNKGASIAIAAIGEAHKAAQVIDSFLNGEVVPYKAPYVVERTVTAEELSDKTKQSRPKMPHLSAEERKGNFNEIIFGYTEEMAKQEASRCLECGCHDYYECKLIEYANQYDVKPARFAGEKHIRKQAQTHPFIERNADKCILCGLCVRVCDEVMGRTALGLVDRGFDSQVQPEFGLALEQTDCVSCGQCVTLCPTGALREKLPIAKAVPMEETMTRTTCSFCGVGCQLDLTSRGGMLLRALPADDGILCAGGRFGFGETQSEDRLMGPLVRTGGKLVEAQLDDALQLAAERLQELVLEYGPEAVAVSISERYTNEEAYLAIRYAREVLGTENIFSFGKTESGFEEVLGIDASFSTLEELGGADVILLAGADVIGASLVAGMQVKKAVENGAKLIVVGAADTQADEWAFKKVKTDDASFLFDLVKAAQGDVGVSAEARELAALYCGAKNAMLVCQPGKLTKVAQKALAAFASVSGHLGRAHNGVILLKSGANSQGLDMLGVKAWTQIDFNKIKGLAVFGEEMPDSVKKPEFLLVQDIVPTGTVQRADVVLPASSFAETDGCYLNSGRRFGTVRKVLQPKCGMETWQIIQALANASQTEDAMEYGAVREVLRDLCAAFDGFHGATKCMDCGKHGLYWPVGKSPVLPAPERVTLPREAAGPIQAQPYNANGIKRRFGAKLPK